MFLTIKSYYQPLCFWGFFRFYLLIFRERGREGEREGEKHLCERNIDHLSQMACSPGMCPRLGIELTTLQFTGRHSTIWATLPRALPGFSMEAFNLIILNYLLPSMCTQWKISHLLISFIKENIELVSCMSFQTFSKHIKDDTYCIFWTIRHPPPNLGGKWGCVLQSEGSLPGWGNARGGGAGVFFPVFPSKT